MSKYMPKPCPFCGSQPVIEPWHGGTPTKRSVACDANECYVNPSLTGETEEEAIARWNRRTPACAELDAAKARIEELHEHLRVNGDAYADAIFDAEELESLRKDRDELLETLENVTASLENVLVAHGVISGFRKDKLWT